MNKLRYSSQITEFLSSKKTRSTWVNHAQWKVMLALLTEKILEGDQEGEMPLRTAW
jgi:hypothetical protein